MINKIEMICWDYRKETREKTNCRRGESSVVFTAMVESIKEARKLARMCGDNIFHLTYPSGVSRKYNTYSV